MLCRCPFSSHRLFPHSIWLGDPEEGLLWRCCHLHSFAFRTTVLEISKHKCILGSSEAKPAGSYFDSQIHCRELQSPCRSPNSHLHHHVMWNRRVLITHFLGLLESSYSFSPKELNWHFYHQEGGAVVECPIISEETLGTWCQVLIHRRQSLP